MTSSQYADLLTLCHRSGQISPSSWLSHIQAGDVATLNPRNETMTSETAKLHFEDPCIHCGLAQSDVQPGPCEGDPSFAKPIAYCSLGVRWDGVQHYRIRMSTGEITEMYRHVSEHAPYYHFGHSDELIQPPRYDESLRSLPPSKD